MKSTSCHLVVLLTTLAGCFSNFAWGQEAADLLGSGALMQHPNAATLLKLDEDQQAKTTEWVDARLEQAANFLAEADLETDAGKVAGLAFIDESESQLQGVLDPRQQELVELVYEASAGFPALRIDSVTAALQLSEKQKKEIESKRKSYRNVKEQHMLKKIQKSEQTKKRKTKKTKTKNLIL